MSSQHSSNLEPSRRSGASAAKTGKKDKLDGWVAHHKETARESLRRMLATPVASAMTWLVIGIAMALPAGLTVFVNNAQDLSRDWDGHAQISLYLQHKTSVLAQRNLLGQLRQREDIGRVELITPDQALQEFEEMSGFDGITEALSDNPLPPLLVVYPLAESLDQAELLRLEISSLPNVEIAQLDMEWVRRLHSWLELAARMVWALAFALAVAVLLVVVNTIRLAIESRRDEIVIVKLVGATDAFVRRPFLYTGLWYGLIGGVIAVVLIQVAMWAIAGPVDKLTLLYGSGFVLRGLGGMNSLYLLLFAAILGLLGAFIAVTKHLREIEPK